MADKTADRSRPGYPVPPGYAPGEAPSFFLPPASPPATISPRDLLLDDFYEALALGVADYFRKTGAFKRLGVATSGAFRKGLLKKAADRHRTPADMAVALVNQTGFGEIRFTLDGTTPASNSPLYAGALTLSNSSCLLARAFATNGPPGEVAAQRSLPSRVSGGRSSPRGGRSSGGA